MNIRIHSRADVADQLTIHGIDLSTISTVFFSHMHFDHVGDATRLPSSCKAVVGPGVVSQCLPGYPENPGSQLCGDAFRDREVHELDFSKATITIAGLQALDWFGDGSFFILDTPGHATGHISALARTRMANPIQGITEAFMLLAGDVCHHMGELRPNQWQHLPDDFAICGNIKVEETFASDYRQVHPHECVDRPFYKPAPGGFNLDCDLMQATVEHIAALDNDPRVLTVLSHDVWILDSIDLFPKRAYDWHEQGQLEHSRWDFLQDFHL